MTSFWRIFWLEAVSLIRSKTLAVLTAVAVGWMLAFPLLVRGDGTDAGLRELCIRYSLGGVFVLLSVVLLASSTGAIARERAAKRLALTLIRPVRMTAVVLGKMLAHLAVGACVLAVACGLLVVRIGLSGQCSHVLSPILPSPAEEARTMYEAYMKDPSTPPAVRQAKKDVVLRLLARRAVDHYQTIPTNAPVSWRFEGWQGADRLAVRMRFTNPMEMRQDVVGEFRIGGFSGSVSNITQAVLEIPLKASSASSAPELVFDNRGRSDLMLRPRRDVNLLVPADAFGWNLLRAYWAMVCALAVLVAAGVFLSATLGRPVALFVALAVLVVGEMSPSVLQQYPDELETDRIDRVGLALTRFAAEVTRPISSLSPLEALAQGECLETGRILRAVALDLVTIPLALALLAAVVLPRKQED